MKDRRKTNRRKTNRRKRDRRKIFKSLGYRFSRSKVIRRVIVLSLILVGSYFLLWRGSYLYNYQPEYYEPRDVEREDEETLP